MAEPIVWENIPKTQTDPTTIDEAIGDAIDVHNADSEAHMAALSSLGEHRENPIIDHPAESVYNDKMTVRARAYVAIVDPESVADFDTLESAIAYAITAGGGNILVTEGDHYLSTVLQIPAGINLYGVDADTCKIHCSFSDDEYLEWPDEGYVPLGTQTFENLQFINDGGGCFSNEVSWEESPRIVRFAGCVFTGNGTYVVQAPANVTFDRCTFECDTSAAVLVSSYCTFEHCRFQGDGFNGEAICADVEPTYGYDVTGKFIDCEIFAGVSATSRPFGATSWLRLEVRFCNIFNGYFTDFAGGGLLFEGNTINIKSTSYFNVPTDNGVFMGNVFTGGTGNRLRFPSGADKNIAIGNQVGTSITNSGSGNQVANNVLT